MLNFLKSIFFERLIQKIIALLLALMTWWLMLQAKQDSGLVVYPVKIVYTEIPKDLILADNLIQSANVTFNIEREGYKDPEDLRLVVNMKNMTIGNNQYQLTEKNLMGPRYNILSIEPSELNIKLDKLIMKEIRVVPKFNDEENILDISKVKIFPKDVFVSGPRSVLNNIDSIPTITIEQRMLQKNQILKANLDLPKFTKIPEDIDFMVFLEQK